VFVLLVYPQLFNASAQVDKSTRQALPGSMIHTRGSFPASHE
jgi:hypothetical protein